MSIHEAADGLLGTHVTWQDVEEMMRNALGTAAKFGENKKATNISDKKGFMSRIALIDPDWIGDQRNEELPKQFIVKMSSLLAFIEMSRMLEHNEGDAWSESKLEDMEKVTKMLHNREVAAYEILMREQNPNIPITKIYALRPFDNDNHLKGFIICDYIPNVHPIGMHECIPVEVLFPVVRAAATFSAIGEKISEKDKEFARGADFLDIVFGQFMDEKTITKFESMIRESFTPEHSEKVEKMLRINRSHYTNLAMIPKFQGICEFFGYRAILTHSDMYSSNFLCTKSGDEVILKAKIDFQTASFSSPAHDIGRMFLGCLSTKDRREKTEYLMEEYYKTFSEELNGLPVPFTMQQFKDSYQLFFPLTAFMILPGIAPMLNFLEVPEGEIELKREIAMEKMTGLVEDFLKIHEENMLKFPMFFEN